MRILYTAFDVIPSPKGASTHITHFVRSLTQAGYDVTLITAGHHKLPKQAEYEGATLLRAPYIPTLNFLERAQAFGDFVLSHVEQAEPYDVVHVRSIWGGIPLSRLKKHFSYKLIYEVNGLPSIEMKYHYPRLRGTDTISKLKQQEISVFRSADHFVTPAYVTGQYIASFGIDTEKIHVIPNGIDVDRFKPGPQRAVNEIPVLLYIGTLADWQGIDILIEAVPEVITQQPVRVRIIGQGRKRQRKHLHKLVRKLELEDTISFEEPLPHYEIPQAIASADVCVAPLSFNDRNVTQGCCPLKILEYIACGTPTVVADLPVARALIREGYDAYFFEPDQSQHLAHQIQAVLDNPQQAQQMAKTGSAYIRGRFTWDQACQSLLALYKSIEG